MHFFSWWWLLWVFVLFLPFELYAARSKTPGFTLSETIWKWFGIKPPKPFGWLRRLILMNFLVALGVHLCYATSAVPVAVFGAMVAAVIGYAVVKER